MKPRIISIHPRKQHNFEQAAQLSTIFKDQYAHVTSVYFSEYFVKLVSYFSKRLSKILSKRSYYNLKRKYVLIYPKSTLKYFIFNFIGKYYSYYMQNVEFQKDILKSRRDSPPDVCISYDGISELIFTEWKGKSKLILDLTIALPQYYFKTQLGNNFNPAILEDMDEFHKRIFRNALIEIELADIILCGSEYVKDSVMYFRPQFIEKCVLLPYGVVHDDFGCPERNFNLSNSLNFVFVGTVDKRKGADILLETWNEFSLEYPNCSLHLFGDIHMDISKCSITSQIKFHGRVSQKELSKKLKEMDVFVLPSLHEGSSIAIYQAMASQLPIITTYNSGSVLKHNDSCFIVNHTKEDLLNAMKNLCIDKKLRAKIAQNAYQTSFEYTWEKYGERLYSIINK